MPIHTRLFASCDYCGGSLQNECEVIFAASSRELRDQAVNKGWVFQRSGAAHIRCYACDVAMSLNPEDNKSPGSEAS